MTDLGELRCIGQQPPQLGGYDLGGIRMMLTRRPHWIARFLCRWLLDWRWKDAP